jgi:DNA-binding LacI/PurR family transcriptional regulator
MHLADEIEEWLTMLSLAHEGTDVLWPQLGLDVTTAKDVADRLGIAVSTVGRALSDDPRISSETKARVAQVAAELGYTPNRAARMMRGASSDVIGLVVPDIRTGLFATVAHVLADALSESAYQLVLVETGDDPRREVHQLRGLVGAQVAGIVIVPTSAPSPETAQLLIGIPHVHLLRRESGVGGQLFGIDDRQVLERATAHLLALGHRRIAYVGGTADEATGAARLTGFRAALDTAGLPESAGPAYLGSSTSVEHGVDAVRRMLVAGRPPTAVVTGSVQATRGVLDELLAQGVRVPDELSIVGFGDEPGWSWWGPGLTTTALPADRLANAAAIWLLHRLANPDDHAEEPTARTLPCPLTVRGSAAPPPATSPATAPPARAGQTSSTTRPVPSSIPQRSTQ